MDHPLEICCTQFTREDGMDIFWLESRHGKGWIVRTMSPVRFYNPYDKMWVVAHAIQNWTPYFVTQGEALRLLSTLDKPAL